MQILIRDVSPEVIKALDKIVAENKYLSRNQLLNEILERYITLKDKFYVDAMTPVIRSMMINEIQKLKSETATAVRTVEAVSLKLLSAAQKIDMYSEEEFWQEEKDFSSPDRKG